MTGFDRRTQLATEQYKNELLTNRERKERIDADKASRDIALKSLQEKRRLEQAQERSALYQETVSKILDSASSGETGSSITSAAIQDAAIEISGQNTHDERIKDIANIYSTLPLLKEALDTQTSIENYHVPYADKREMKRQFVIFNHVLKRTIDNDPKITPEELFSHVESAALTYGYAGNVIEQINDKTRICINGMRHELAFESALYRLGYDVQETTFEDDLSGIDYRVRTEEGYTVEIDVKKSEHAVSMALEKHSQSGRKLPPNRLVMWSGFMTKDFEKNSPWRPTEKAIDRALPLIESTIVNATSNMTSSKTTS
jgi:hypothetical protein